ncbi:MAG: hypothetical protein CGW95_00985 [Phenylobacterium zucineum]|nr:MAG: hypothetical protein CGW95_00985 [Phenylobacterium zucineum]
MTTAERLNKLVHDHFAALFPGETITVEEDGENETWNVYVADRLHFDFAVGSDDDGFYFTEVEERHAPVEMEIPDSIWE